MPTSEYSPIIEAAGTLDGLRKTVDTVNEQVADLCALVRRFETARITEIDDLIVDLDNLTNDLLTITQGVGSTVGVAIEEVAVAIWIAGMLPDNSQLVDAVLDVERGLERRRRARAQARMTEHRCDFPGCTRRPLRWAPSCRLHRWWRAWLGTP